MIRWSKIVLILLVALWGLFGLLGNLMKLDVAWAMVLATTSMPGVEPANAPPWATQSPVVAALGVALIVAGKLIPAVMCGWGGMRMLAARQSDEADWHRSKSLAVAGCALTVASLFLGWVVVGEFIFMMYLDPGLAQASSAAFRYSGFIGLTMIFVAQRE